MWNRVWGHALRTSPGINRKSRVLYPGPKFLSSAAWPSMPKKHFSGLIIIINSYFDILSLILCRAVTSLVPSLCGRRVTEVWTMTHVAVTGTCPVSTHCLWAASMTVVRAPTSLSIVRPLWLSSIPAEVMCLQIWRGHSDLNSKWSVVVVF